MRTGSLMRRIGTTVACSTLLLAASCDEAASPVSAENLTPEASVHSTRGNVSLLQSVKQATARYNSTVQAIRAGYEPTDHCVGEMGYHWANSGLVDPVFDPLKPEVMLYASGPSGNPELVAVEYVVIDVGQPHPHFGDHPFDIGGTPVPVPHYSLHVWLYKDNPVGIFTPFNPSVSCP
jgi:hypothetical protein